jgi:hypothetical protein
MGETRAEGRLEGAREIVERLLSQRFGPLPDAVRARIREADHAELDRLSAGLFEATSLDQLMNPSA